MKRRSFLLTAPEIVLAAACVFAAARVSTSRPVGTPPYGSGVNGPNDVRESQAPDRPDRPDPPATQGPDAAPRRVQPFAVPPENDRAWLQDWLELVARPTGTAALGC